MTGGGTFAACVPPHGLHSNSPPSALLQQRALRQRFASYFSSGFAYTVMHGRQIYSNIARLPVRCSIRVCGVESVSLLMMGDSIGRRLAVCTHISHQA